MVLAVGPRTVTASTLCGQQNSGHVGVPAKTTSLVSDTALTRDNVAMSMMSLKQKTNVGPLRSTLGLISRAEMGTRDGPVTHRAAGHAVMMTTGVAIAIKAATALPLCTGMGWSPVEISIATKSLERAALIATVCATRHEMSRDAGAQD